MSGPLTKARLIELFDRLNEKLKRADQHAELYIVGGAMMALAHDAQRVTDDVDSHIRQGREAVTKAVAEIADEEGLSRYWLNEAVTLRHLPEDPDRGERRVYSNTHLRIDGRLDQPDDRDEAARGPPPRPRGSRRPAESGRCHARGRKPYAYTS